MQQLDDLRSRRSSNSEADASDTNDSTISAVTPLQAANKPQLPISITSRSRTLENSAPDSPMSPREPLNAAIAPPLPGAKHEPERKETPLRLSPRTSWWARVFSDTWIPEFLSLVASAACIIAIAGVLYSYDGSASPEIPYGITLNAIISILATTSKSLQLFAIASAISQQKWR